jgi:hypothetical protein
MTPDRQSNSLRLIEERTNQLDSLNEFLCEHAQGLIHNLLQTRVRVQLQEMLSPDRAHSAERAINNLGLFAMAMASQQGGKAAEVSTKIESPAWLRIIRSEISAYAADDPEARSGLLRTVFFTDSLKKMRQLERSIGNSTTSHDVPDDPLAFASGVATGSVYIDY